MNEDREGSDAGSESDQETDKIFAMIDDFLNRKNDDLKCAIDDYNFLVTKFYNENFCSAPDRTRYLKVRDRIKVMSGIVKKKLTEKQNNKRVGLLPFNLHEVLVDPHKIFTVQGVNEPPAGVPRVEELDSYVTGTGKKKGMYQQAKNRIKTYSSYNNELIGMEIARKDPNIKKKVVREAMNENCKKNNMIAKYSLEVTEEIKKNLVRTMKLALRNIGEDNKPFVSFPQSNVSSQSLYQKSTVAIPTTGLGSVPTGKRPISEAVESWTDQVPAKQPHIQPGSISSGQQSFKQKFRGPNKNWNKQPPNRYHWKPDRSYDSSTSNESFRQPWHDKSFSNQAFGQQGKKWTNQFSSNRNYQPSTSWGGYQPAEQRNLNMGNQNSYDDRYSSKKNIFEDIN